MMASHTLMGLGRRKVGQRLSNTFCRSCVARNETSSSCIQPTFKFGDRYFSTDSGSETSNPSRYAVVDHSEAYEREISGRHGAQLELAKIAGIGRDDPDFDPFQDQLYELMETNEEGNLDGDDDDGDLEDDSRDVEKEAADIDENNDKDDGDEEVEEIDEEAEIIKTDSNSPQRIRRKKSEIATLAAGAPAGGVFAVVRIAGAQHKVTEDDVVILNKLQPVTKYSVGSVHTLTDILLVSSSHLTLVGMPVVAGAEVDVMVEEITQDAKVIVFKNRRRKNSRRKNGFRREVTLLRILEIRMPEEYNNHKHNLGEHAMELEA